MTKKADFTPPDDAIDKALQGADLTEPPSPLELRALEDAILRQIDSHPQRGRLTGWLPSFTDLQLPWPAVTAGAMVLGLLAGYGLTAVITPPASQEYLMTLATSEPWQDVSE